MLLERAQIPSCLAPRLRMQARTCAAHNISRLSSTFGSEAIVVP